MVVTARMLEPTTKLRYFWIDYLRGINILLTLVFHSFIAYSPFIQSLSLDTVPIPYVDRNTQIELADLMVLLRPMFSMQLMFFISGLFAWRGLEKRGSKGYIRERFKRLMLPLAGASLVLMPITYLPGYVSGEFGGMFRITLAHLWFLWVLFIFDIALAALYYGFKKPIEAFLNEMTTPWVCALSGVGVVVSYLPFVLSSSEIGWDNLFGSSFLLLPTAWLGQYFFYFLLGVCMGNHHLNVRVKEECWLSPVPNGRQGLMFASISSAILLICFVAFRISFKPIARFLTTFWASVAINAIYALAGLAIVVLLILMFKIYLNTRVRLLDNLSVNSYSIYIIHYTVVVWWQFGVSNTATLGMLKPWIVSLSSIVFCWLASDQVRRIREVRRMS